MGNKTIKIISTLLIAKVLLLGSCDKVSEPYMSNQNLADTTACPIPDFGNYNPVKKVLLEEFTGHKCPNCPNGAAIAESLKGLHGSQLVVVAVHAGYFAEPDATGEYTANYITGAGEAIATNFGVILNPTGMVNRKAFNSNMVLSPSNWGDAISDALNETNDIYIQIISEYSSVNNNEICIHIKTDFLNDLSGNFNLVVQIKESGMVSPQKTNDPNFPSGFINDYVHKNVLRSAVNGTWGIEITNGNISAGTSIINSYKIPVNSQWLLQSCNIVAYIFNSATDEILQAEEVGLLPN